jgi:hypothetical protein
MGRYLLLVVLAAPSLWTAYDEWRRGQEGPAPAAPVTSAALPVARCEELSQQANTLQIAATEGRKAWSERALRLEGGGAAPEPPDLLPQWKALLAATTGRAESLAKAKDFADLYRAAARAETYPQADPLRRALGARAVEVRLLRLRMNGAPVSEKALLDGYDKNLKEYVATHGQSPEFNTEAHALLQTWLRGNRLLLNYPKHDLLTLLHTALADVQKTPEGPLFRPDSLTKAEQAVREMKAFSALPGAAGDPLAPRVAALLSTWEKDQGMMEEVKGWSAGPKKIRAVARVAAALLHDGEPRVGAQARAAASRLCDKFLPVPGALDDAVLIEGQRVPCKQVVILWGDGRPDSPLRSTGPEGETYDEFWLKKLVQDDKAKGVNVRFVRAGEKDAATRAARLVAPTPKSIAARTFENARLALSRGDWTLEQLKALLGTCAATDERPALPEELPAYLQAILNEQVSFFPPAPNVP